MSSKSSIHDTVTALSGILDRIDSSKPLKQTTIQQPVDTSSKGPSSSVSDTVAPSLVSSSSHEGISTASKTGLGAIASEVTSSTPLWFEYFDPSSQKCYYYHIITKETTWIKPEDSYVPIPPKSSPASNALSNGDEYRFSGAFNTQKGHFTALQPHLFDQVFVQFSYKITFVVYH